MISIKHKASSGNIILGIHIHHKNDIKKLKHCSYTNTFCVWKILLKQINWF